MHSLSHESRPAGHGPRGIRFHPGSLTKERLLMFTLRKAHINALSESMEDVLADRICSFLSIQFPVLANKTLHTMCEQGRELSRRTHVVEEESIAHVCALL